MKPLLLAAFVLAFVLPSHAQLAGSSAMYRGEYFGIMNASPTCANERLAIEIEVSPDGEVSGRVRDWPDNTLLEFSQSWPHFAAGKFITPVSGLGNTVKGSFSKNGTVRGTVTFASGCRYTFTAFRRYRIQP